MAIFDDNQIELFNQSLQNGFSCADPKSKESDFAICLEALWIGSFFNQLSEFKIYSEISDAWNRISKEEFNAYHKKDSWIWKCFHWSSTFYGIIPVSQMLKIVHINKDIHVSEEELIDIYRHFPKALGSCYEKMVLLEDDCFVSYKRFGKHIYNSEEDKKEIQKNKEKQGDKDFYLPSGNEIELFNNNPHEYFLHYKAYQKYCEYMEQELGVSKEVIRHILDVVNAFAKRPYNSHYNFELHIFLKNKEIRFTSDEQVEKAAELFIEVINGTRMNINRGYTPEELYLTNGISPDTEKFEITTVFYRAPSNQVCKNNNNLNNEEPDISNEGQLYLKLQADLENGHLILMDMDIN